ncbi:MAG TPA: nucleoside deaminase [Candidatus Acidoferrales bacterium]|nr:nucleoside deaminase [Candidatus Acidoferrales bacterium]
MSRRVVLLNPSVKNKFMARAIALSIENVRSGRGGPFGAVIVRSGRIIAEAANCVTRVNDPTAHAEVTAIRRACGKLRAFELKECDIYTSCEPCPMCVGAIYWARLRCVYYAGTAADAANAGFDDQFIYREIGRAPARRKIPMVRLMHEDALAAFRAWKESGEKILY